MKKLNKKLQTVFSGLFTFCFLVICSLVFVSIPVHAAGSDGVYEFECHYGVEDGNKYNTDAWYEYTFYGENISFATLYAEFIINGKSYYELRFVALSNEYFTLDWFLRRMTTSGDIFLDGGSAGTGPNKVVYKDQSFYVYSSAILAYSMDKVYGFPNLIYRGFFENQNSIDWNLDSLYDEFITNGGLDWEVDTSKYNDFKLTGVSYKQYQIPNVYDIYWTGTTLSDERYDSSSSGRPHNNTWKNGTVDAFTILYDMFGREYTEELGSVTLETGKITISFDNPDFLRDSFDGKIYLRPHIDLKYDGKTYYGAYTVLNIKTGLIYDVSSTDGSKTYTWDDFYLSNVKLSKDLIGYYKISWQGTTRSSDLIYVPDSDTLVVAAIALEDSSGNIINQEIASTTIGKGYFYFDVDKLLDQDRESAYYWDGMIYLMPTFTKEGDLYMGQYTVVDALSGDIYRDVLDEDNETVHRDPVEPSGSSDSSFGISSMSDYISTGFNFLSDLIKMMGSFPALFASVFQFMPDIYVKAIGTMLIVIFIGRILGR